MRSHRRSLPSSGTSECAAPGRDLSELPRRALGRQGARIQSAAKQFLALGLNPEVIHRIASLATAGLDVMPHNGAVITALAVVGLTHKQAYKPIFMLAVVTPILTNALAIVVAMAIY